MRGGLALVVSWWLVGSLTPACGGASDVGEQPESGGNEAGQGASAGSSGAASGRGGRGGAAGGTAGSAGAAGGTAGSQAGSAGTSAGAGGSAGDGAAGAAGSAAGMPGAAGAAGVSPYTGPQWALPAVTARKPFESFDGTNGKLPLVPWPNRGGWMVSPFGLPVVASLDETTKHDGRWSMKLDYRLGDTNQAGIAQLYSPPVNWSGYDAVRFWLVPDGSKTAFAVNLLNEAAGHTFFEAKYPMIVTEPVIVTIPFTRFVDFTNPAGQQKRLDVGRIDEVTFWLRGYLPNPNKTWTIRVDAIEAVKLAAPLDRVVAWPASMPAPP